MYYESIFNIQFGESVKIKKKLLLSYLIITALVVAAGATITYNSIKMAELQNNVKLQQDINSNAFAYQRGIDQKQFGTLMYSADQVDSGIRIIVDSADIMNQTQTYLTANLASNPDLFAKFNEVVSIDTNQINPGIGEIQQIYSGDLNSSVKYTQIWDKLLTIMGATDTADLKLAEVRTATQSNVQNAVNESQNYANLSLIITVAFIALLVVASVVMSMVIGNRITIPLKNLANIAQKVTEGDLDQRYYLKQNIDLKKGDEIDELTDAFKKMINAFRMQETLLKGDEGKDKL
jgi:nitrogen fixation/metabolism regulation signal transduction histidine kinase